MTISYTRTFSHTDWVDNVDGVQAGGDSGLNGRFHGVEAEFDALSGVVSTADATFTTQSGQITTLQQQVSALGGVVTAPVLLTLVAIFNTVGNSGWQQTFDGVVKPSGAAAANGVMNVQIPNGMRIQWLRAVGTKQSGVLGVNLYRQSLTGPSGGQRIVSIDAPVGAFDQTVPAPTTDVAKISPDFRYYLTAELSGAGPTDNIALFGLQLSYIGK